MTHHIGYIPGSKPEPFSPSAFRRSGTGLEESTPTTTKSRCGWRRKERRYAKR